MSAQVVVSHAGVVTDVAGSVVRIGIIVPELSNVMEDFDQIEVWKSAIGASGPFYELTGEVAGPAVVRTGYDGAQKIAGKDLVISVTGTATTVTFDGPDPVSLSSMAAQVTAKSSGRLTGEVDGLRALFKTVQTGLQATQEVTGGAAAAALGMLGLQAHGNDGRIALVSQQAAYTFVDPHGSQDAYYTFRWSNSDTELTSAFYPAFRPSPTTRPSPEQYCMGYCRLVDPEGIPVANRSVFVGTEVPVRMDGSLVLGASGWRLTNTNGYVWFTLLRGAELTVAISGTSIVRRITVPIASDVSSFDLLDPAVGTDDDAFKVQVPNLDFVVRRSL